MAINHKFLQNNFGNGFETHNAILDVVPYEPEVIFIGTFNHGWTWNNSDFYYGRGMYMWPVMANLFLHNSNQLIKPRTLKNNIPTSSQMFEICEKGKMVFADIVKGTKVNVQAIEQLQNKSIIVNNQYEWTTYKDGPLDEMGARGWLDDNVSAIIKYINETMTIKHIYFTFKSGNWLVDKLSEIKLGVREDVSACSIFTPTANGFGKDLDPPFNERAWGLTHCWVWNGLNHIIPINRPGYGHLDHNWLTSNGVNPNNF